MYLGHHTAKESGFLPDTHHASAPQRLPVTLLGCVPAFKNPSDEPAPNVGQGATGQSNSCQTIEPMWHTLLAFFLFL